jgi:hypothetical protein
MGVQLKFIEKHVRHEIKILLTQEESGIHWGAC